MVFDCIILVRFVVLISTFIGIAVIKTIIEVLMYQFPIALKFSSNFVAYVADVIPLIIGVILSKKIKMEK